MRLDQMLPLGPVVEKAVAAKYLFIDPELGVWLSLDEDDARVFRQLAAHATLADVLTGSDVDRGALAQLIARVLQAGFLGDRVGFGEPTQTTRHVQFHLTNRCNLRCTHCYMDSGVKEVPEFDATAWCQLLDLLVRRHERIVLSVSGGEPLISPALFPVLEKARAFGLETAVITNGVLLNGRRLERLASLVDVCAISFDGLSPATHDRIRGAGMFARTWANLLALRPPPFRVVLNITALKTNADEVVNELPAFVSRIPFDVDIDIGTLISEGRGIQESAIGLPPSEFRQVLTTIAGQFIAMEFQSTRVDARTPQVMSSGLSGVWKPIPMRRKSNCGYAETLTIYANGDLGTCITPRFIRGNLFADGAEALLDEIDHERSLTMVDRLPECRSCALRHVCGGRCHLPQLRSGASPAQVDCPQSYKDSMLKNLAAWGAS